MIYFDLIRETLETAKEYRVKSFINSYKSSLFKPSKLKQNNQLIKSKVKEIIKVAFTRIKVKQKLKVKQIKTLKQLNDFKSHKKLKVFISKGCRCVNCGVEGIILVNHSSPGYESWAIFTESLIPLTVDHIIPKSKGGGNTMDNLQPMCKPCNSKKADSMNDFNFINVNQTTLEIGDRVYYKKNNRYYNVGFIKSVLTTKVKTNVQKNNSHFQRYYSKSQLYKLINKTNQSSLDKTQETC